jgi:hypothetical protein
MIPPPGHNVRIGDTDYVVSHWKWVFDFVKNNNVVIEIHMAAPEEKHARKTTEADLLENGIAIVRPRHAEEDER